MPELPAVTQEFIADTAPYVAGLEAAIAVTDRFRESVEQALVAVEALHAAIDDLPNEKTIHIHVEQDQMPTAGAAAGGGNVNTSGLAAEAAAARDAANAVNTDTAANERLDQILKQEGGDWAALNTLANEGSAANRNAAASANEAANALRGLVGANDETRAAVQSLINQGIDPMDAAWSVVMNKAGSAGEAVRQAGADAAAATAPMQQLAAATQSGSISANDAARNEYMLAAAERMRANTARDAANAATASGSAARGAYGWWGVLTKEVTLWGGVLGSAHLIGSVQLWHIALDGLFESAVALGEALASLTVGLAAMSYAGQDIYNHLMAVNTVNNALGSSIPPLTGKFQDLGKAMASQTVEAYGGALNLVNQNSKVLAQVAHEVVTGLDDWIAKLDLWKASQKSTGALLQNGVGFLHQFMQMVDNVGLAIANLVKADPGTAHYLMDLVVGFTQVLDVITKIPAPILMAGMALHSFMLWGGLLFTGLTKLLIPIQALATSVGGISKADSAVQNLAKDASGLDKLKATLTDIGTGFGNMGTAVAAWGSGIKTAARDAEEGQKASAALGAAFGGLQTKISGLLNGFMALAASPWAWAIAGAALIAALAYQATQADHATKSFIADMDNGLANMTASQAIPQITSNIGQLNTKLGGVGEQLIKQSGNWTSLSGVMTMAKTVFMGLTGGFTDGLMRMNADANAFTGEIVKLTAQQKNLFTEMGALVKQGYSYQQSLALMDLAGVKAGDTLDLMRQKVNNLITGYQNMGVQGGILSNAVNAVTFATELQNSKIQQVTQSFTTFLGVVTGGESALVTAEQGLTGLAAAATGAGDKMTVTNGKTRVTTTATAGLGTAAASTATQIGGLSQSSQQLTSTWTQAITNGGNLVNALLTQSAAAGMGAKGYNLVSGAAKDYMQQLLPMAKGNQLATADLYALAQTAGYQGAPSFQALSQWIGKTSNAGQDLQNKETTLATASAGLTNDMNALAQAVSGNLNAAMSAAILQANGGQTAFNNFANAAVKAHGSTDGMTASATALANELIATTGNTNQAHAMFDTFSTSLGLSKGAADRLWASVTTASGAVKTAGGDANSTAGNMGTLSGSLFDSTNKASALSTALGSIHSVSATVSINYVAYGAIPGGAAGSIQAKLMGQQGFRVPGGYGGGDIVPAMLEPGETVVPKHLTATVAPLMKAHNVPGFRDGGIMDSDGGYGRWAMQDLGMRVDHLTDLIKHTGGYGYARRGHDRHWGGDSSPALPPAAGASTGGGAQTIHIPVYIDGNKIASAMVPYSAASAARYQVRNSGRTTGAWGTGWKS